MTRRQFIQAAGAATIAGAVCSPIPGLAAATQPTAAKLPRWRGFNLLEKFSAQKGGNPPYQETDFQILSEWGFNFVRLPMSYRCWSEPEHWREMKESQLKDVDGAIEFGRRYGVHVNLNLHRAPGYCVNPPKEPMDLWTEDRALEACAYQWGRLARRYRGIPNDRVSFDLLNEPPDIPADVYRKVVAGLVKSIRAEDPDRLIIADGLRWGTVPVPSLADLHIAQSTRGYEPMEVSHYRAGWVGGSDQWPMPTWPLHRGTEIVDRETLRRTRIEPWKKLEADGVGVHVGEWGCYNRTPHDVALAWMRDCLELWQEAGWGWAVWNLRGDFGPLDSGRSDVTYEDFRGQKLDRKMLELLREH